MPTIGLDTETFLIRPGLQIPKLVCMSWYDGRKSYLLERERAVPKFREFLEDPSITLACFNAPFDLAVMARQDISLLRLIRDAIVAGRIRCGMIRAMLFDIASGDFTWQRKKKYTLARMIERKFERVVAKEDTFRLRYAELDGVRAEHYPKDASTYAMEDAKWHYLLWAKQEMDLQEDELDEVPDERPQTRAALWLYMMGAWGLRSDPVAVNKLDTEMTREMDALRVELVKSGIVRAKTKRDTKAVETAGLKITEVCSALAKEKRLSVNQKLVQELVLEDCQARSIPAVRTPSGQVCIDDEELKKTTNERLKPLRRYSKLSHDHGLYMPFLKEATRRPINPRWNVLVETGRTSCAKPNLQNPPRKGGFRECFVPRSGYLFAFADYDTLELRTHAQNCLELFGYSKLADDLIAGKDPHTAFGADLLGISYEEMAQRLKDGDPVAEEARQDAKPGNFGLPGGMGIDAMIAYYAGYGRTLTRDRAMTLKQKWLGKYSENVDYFSRTSDIVGDGTATQVQLKSGRVRGKCRYTDFNNGYFQARAADGAKDALCHVSEECYLEPSSPLFGSRPIIFLHDEIGTEVFAPSLAHASAAALRQQAVMEARMQTWIPNIPAKATVVLMRRWYKGAKPVYRDGMLVPSKPMKTPDGKTKWVEDVIEERAAA